MAPCLGLASLITSCSFYLFQPLLLLFVPPQGEGNSNKWHRITADPLAPLCALSWGWRVLLLCPSSHAAGCAVSPPKGVGSLVCRSRQTWGFPRGWSGRGGSSHLKQRAPLCTPFFRPCLPCTLHQSSRTMLLFPKSGARGPPLPYYKLRSQTVA